MAGLVKFTGTDNHLVEVSEATPFPVTVVSGGGGGTVDQGTGGSSPWLVAISQTGSNNVVTATDFDIRDLVFATDKVDVSGSSVSISASGTSTRSQVADSASEVLLLASNAARLGATVYNDSSALLYLGLGTTTVTSTNYTTKVFSNGYYEVPAKFTGQVRGIWATDPNDGAARVTELT